MFVHAPKPRHELLTAKIARLFYRDSDRTSSIGAREVTLAIHSIEPLGFRFGLHLHLYGAHPGIEGGPYRFYQRLQYLRAVTGEHRGLRTSLARQPRPARGLLCGLDLLSRGLFAGGRRDELQLDAELRSMIPGHYDSSPCGPRLPGSRGRSGGFLARPTIWSGLTGTRESFRPVASRKAATIAGVEAMVGGSPTPLSP